ncbi:MAG: hypothetical protein ACLUD2_05745 [Clostridium sp.]
MLKGKYNAENMNFSNILCTVPNREDTRKVSAVYSEENAKGELIRLRILFACYIQLNGENGYKDSVAYIPVELDFLKKNLIIKAWVRQQIALDEYKAENLMIHIKNILGFEFNVKTKNYFLEHKKVLFLMSKNLISEAYSRIPTYNEIWKMDGVVKNLLMNY